MTSCPHRFLLSHHGDNGKHKTGFMKFVLALLIATLTLCDSAIAATGDPLDLQIRYGHYYASLLINEDGTSAG